MGYIGKSAICLTKLSDGSNNATQAEGILLFPLEEKQFVFSYKKVVIMKKTLAAVAVLGAFAGTALAADVTLYGKIDTGLQYLHSDVENVTIAPNGVATTENVKSDSWGLKSGINSGSRFGIKGTEKISEGLTVGFQLENGFESDDGSMKYGKEANDRIFGREARLYIQTDFGEIGLGRMGGLDSGSGSYDIFGGDAGVFGTGWSGIGSDSAIFRGMSSRMDNVITYKSPSFAGVTVYAQASLKKDSDNDGAEGSAKTDRYYALGATGEWGALSGAVVFSTTDYNNTWAGNDEQENGHESNSKVLSAYAAYDFGVVKTTLGAQYYDDVKGSPWSESTVTFVDGNGKPVTEDEFAGWDDLSTKGYGVMLGATAPIAAGTLYASVGYADYEVTVDSDYTFDAFQVGIGYTYPLSKRTYLYTAAGYTKISGDGKEDGHSFSADDKTTEVVAGLVHNF